MKILSKVFCYLAFVLISCNSTQDSKGMHNTWSKMFRVDGSRVFQIIPGADLANNEYFFYYNNFKGTTGPLLDMISDNEEHFPDGIIRFNEERIFIDVPKNPKTFQSGYSLRIVDYNMNLGDTVGCVEQNERVSNVKLVLLDMKEFNGEILYHFKLINYIQPSFGYILSKSTGIKAIYSDELIENRGYVDKFGDRCVLELFLK